MPNAAEPVGGGLEGVIERLPPVGTNVGQISAKQEAVDQIDLVVGLCLPEGGVGLAVGNAVGSLAEEAEGDVGGLQQLDQCILGGWGWWVEAVDGDPMAALL